MILLVIVEARIEAACSIPARKLAGAAIAAASNRSVMVRPPPDVSATREPGPACATFGLDRLVRKERESAQSEGRRRKAFRHPVVPGRRQEVPEVRVVPSWVGNALKQGFAGLGADLDFLP